MIFTDGVYYIFLIAVFFIYWSVGDRDRLRVIFLVAASCLFYWHASGVALMLLLSIAAIDYAVTRSMAQCHDLKRRKRLLIISLAVDIIALSIFKYADFFIESAAGGLSLFGFTIADARLNVIAPIGISFFIFQSLACVIDVYRADIDPAESFLDYLALVSFFPTIIAGPILRAKHLLPQLRRPLALDGAAGGQALFLISIGLIKKIAIADYLSANLVDRVFDFPERFSSFEVLAAVYGYSLQIYADFSGYSDIALGSALLLGLRLPPNFNSPYRASDLPEFWRRWHISLSTWLRDYVFYSFVGARARNAAVLYLGLVITMLIGGLWHGPAWTFVLWGLMHGVGLAAVRLWAALRKRAALSKRKTRLSNLFGVLLTFHFVCLTWIFFRAETLDQAFGVLRQMAACNPGASNLAPPIIMLVMVGFIAHWIPDSLLNKARDGFSRLPATAQACALFALAIGLNFIASSDVVPFIYSRF